MKDPAQCCVLLPIPLRCGPENLAQNHAPSIVCGLRAPPTVCTFPLSSLRLPTCFVCMDPWALITNSHGVTVAFVALEWRCHLGLFPPHQRFLNSFPITLSCGLSGPCRPAFYYVYL